MINCAHPNNFAHLLQPQQVWLERIHAARANASCKSHAELDESDSLDAGNPVEIGSQYRQLLSKLNVLGDCCGTDHRHIEAICTACAA